MPKGSSPYGSSPPRPRLTIRRSTATPAATPAAATPTTAPINPARLRLLATGAVEGGSANVRPRHPPAAHAGHYLVGDRVDRSRPVLGGRLAPVARAEQHDLVAVAHLGVTDVDHELVHAHPPRDPVARAV